VATGLLLLDKPAGITSNRALQDVRRLFANAKAGHCGTLDPLATGLLLLCFGKATKAAGRLTAMDKTYRATLTLGVTTDSGDAEGTVTARREVAVGATEVAAALGRFRGEILQVPPMFSAIKRGGQPLYKLARRGISVPREPRRVTVRRLDLLGVDGAMVRVELTVTSGFYVRSFAADLGEVLGCGAALSALRRTAVGPFTVAEAHTATAIAALPAGRAREALLVKVGDG